MKIKQTSNKVVGQETVKEPKWFDTVYDEYGNIIQEGHYEEIEIVKNIVKDVTEEVEVDDVPNDDPKPYVPTDEERLAAIEGALLELILGGAL